MWFAYVDQSMSWYDLDVQEVKKLLAQNKKGEKAPPLEELKTNDIPVKSVDLIQENNVDRFERRNRNSGKNQKRRPNNQNQNQPRDTRKPAENQKDKPNQPRREKQAPENGKPVQPQAKKFKKKTPRKRDENT